MSDHPVTGSTDNSHAASDSGLPAKRRPSWPLALLFLVPVLAVGTYAARMLDRAPAAALGERDLAEHSGLALDLSRPDALIESDSLAQLPRDLLRMPLLRDVLTEDLVFYYESNADRLGIAGALRRIVYEHELTLRDSLIEELLDQPAEVALWRGRDGKLGHILLRIERGSLARLLQPLAEVAASDTQLSVAGELHVEGESVPVLRLRYNAGRALLMVAHADNLLVLSSPAMLQEDEGAQSRLGKAQAETLERLLAEGSGFPQRFGLGERWSTHRLTVSSEYLALGYGQFVPRLAGIRMEMDGQGWSGAIALQPETDADSAAEPLWSALPMGASACTAVPLSRTALAPLFAELGTAELLPAELGKRLGGPLALCWYGSSRLHTPLLVTRLGEGPEDASDLDLFQAFESMVGAYEARAEGGRFPVEQLSVGKAVVWKRAVGSSHGLHPASAHPQPESLSNEAWFRVALARHGRLLLFSLDDALVEQALATLDQRFPPLSETLPPDREIPLYIAADSLASLIEKETLRSLPADLEPLFRNAAENHLLPKLRALGQHQRFALSLPRAPSVSAEWTWLSLDWTAL